MFILCSYDKRLCGSSRPVAPGRPRREAATADPLPYGLSELAGDVGSGLLPLRHRLGDRW
jgi:hypothetical protein